MYLKTTDPKFDFEAFMTYVGEEYQTDTDLINVIKSIRNEIEDLIAFMTPRIAQDRSIFNVKSI